MIVLQVYGMVWYGMVWSGRLSLPRGGVREMLRGGSYWTRLFGIRILAFRSDSTIKVYILLLGSERAAIVTKKKKKKKKLNFL
jgi:hypothetical protein